MGKIQLTPSELQSQATEMQALQTEYSLLFSGVSTDLKHVNGNWSSNLSNNFEGKINSAQKSFTQITQELMKGSKVANTCAVTFESVDSELAKLSQEPKSKTANIAQMSEKPMPIDVGYYLENVTDAEYAKLCHLTYNALKSEDEDPQKAFIDLLRENLPDNDPLKNISSDQVFVTEVFNGFYGITIVDGDNALVIFAGTNSKRDWLDNILLGAARPTPQSTQAIEMIKQLSKNHSNIVVTGHSLGGYLATAATLKNPAVSKCVAFDPPGRYDASQIASEISSKIITYEAEGSLVSEVASGVGNVRQISVNENGGVFDHNHGIKEISDALNEQYPMENAWK